MQFTSLEKNILTYMKKLSEDNQYILLSYAHELHQEEKKELIREQMIYNGKEIVEQENIEYIERLHFCTANNLICYEYYLRKRMKN